MGINTNKVYVHVFGCRSSLCEGEFIAGSLKAMGAEITEDLTENNINAAVIVTCSVTQEAGRKCRQLIRRIRKILGNDGIICVCGCWSQNLDVDEAKKLEIDILAGSKGKNIIPKKLLEIMRTGRKFIDLRTQNIFLPSEWEELSINSPVMHSRAFIKIQDGCDHFCTYCIIPFLRGRPVSRPANNILDEIKRLIDNGTKEIIFTGIHLGIYGQDINFSLAQLIRETSKIHELKRLRLGSLEPFCLNDDLLNALNECEAFCEHLHLPVQSGDDEILSKMRRGYKSKDFINLCEHARKILGENLHISTDILVGFPGESENAFMNTLNLMKESKLGRVHVFPYSEREGTIAAKMPQKIPHAEKISRTSRAIELGNILYNNYMKKFINHDVDILLEKNNKGHTKQYIEAICDGENNSIVRAKVIGVNDGRFECVRRD